MEKKHIINRMVVVAYSAKKFMDRGNMVLAAYYFGRFAAEGARLSAGDAWKVADDPKVPHITRERVNEMFENAHAVYEKLIAPALNN